MFVNIERQLLGSLFYLVFGSQVLTHLEVEGEFLDWLLGP